MSNFLGNKTYQKICSGSPVLLVNARFVSHGSTDVLDQALLGWQDRGSCQSISGSLAASLDTNCDM